jgi:quercetin dioxygenase-like cupin family protein
MYSWMTNNNNALQRQWNDDSIIVPSNHNEQFESNGNILKVVVPTTITNDRYGVYDIEMEPNARGPKLHYHKLMDETFIVREGTLTVLTANGETKVGPGTVIHIPRLAAHGYNNDTEGSIKMTMIFNPGLGREAFFRKMYQILDENPNDLIGFNQLYQENDSYALNEQDMIPMS